MQSRSPFRWPNGINAMSGSSTAFDETGSPPLKPLSRQKLVVLNVAMALSYAVFGWLGIMLSQPAELATLLWPASGVAMAFMIFYGAGLAPGVLIGSFIVNCSIGGVFGSSGISLAPVPAAIGIAVFVTAQASFGALVARRLFGVPINLSGSKDLLALAIITGPLACLIAPSGGVATLAYFGMLKPTLITSHWITWWLGDLLGIAVALPLVLLSPWRPWALRWYGAPVIAIRVGGLLLLLLAVSLSVYAWKLTSKETHDRNGANFAGLAAENERALIYRMDSYARALNGAAGLIKASDEVTLADWKSYVDALDLPQKLRGVSGIGFIEQVPEGGLDAVMARYRKLGLTDLNPHPEVLGTDNFMVTYIEPAEDNKNVSGLNIAFDNHRKAAAIRARDTGKPTITRRTYLPQDPTHSAAFLLLRPLYAQGAPTRTVAERRKAFLGWIYAPFVGFNFLRHLSVSQGYLVALQVYDGDQADPENLFYDGKWAVFSLTEPQYTITKTIELFGQHWTLNWSSTPAFEASVKSSEPALVLAAGLLLSSMLAVYLLSYARREEFARRIVDVKTREVAEREVENRALIDTAMVGIVLLDETGKVLSANRAAHDMFCAVPDSDEDTDVTFLEALGFDDGSPSRVINLISRSDAGETGTNTVSIHCKGDRELEVDLQMNHWRTEAGADRYTVIARDVSVQSRMRIALEQAEERWALALSGAQIGVFDTDLSNRKTIVSDVWLQMIGFGTEDDIDPMTEWEKRLHPEDRERVHAAHRACLTGEEDHAKLEYRIRHRDGRWIWLRSDAMVIERDDTGRALRYVGTEIDITDLRLAEAAHLASEERFSSAFEHAPTGMALLDLDGHWIKVNDAICRFFGFRKDELLRTTLENLIHPDDSESNRDQIKRLMAGEIDTYQLEMRYIHRNGATVWGLLSVSLTRDATGEPNYFILQILDINHRREVDKLQAEFISTVNHELRTPLTAIQGALGLLKASFDERANLKEKTLLRHSYESSQRLARLVNDILDVERMSQGELDYRIETTDVVALARRIIESQVLSAEKWGVRIDAKLPRAEIAVDVDVDRFSQALINIISNAAKFSNGADRIVVSVTQLADERVSVSVQDFGPGIPAAFRPKIFGKFAQADSSSTRKAQGSGLGLSITKSIIEALGGSVDFHSVEGEGSTFYFLIPVSQRQERRA